MNAPMNSVSAASPAAAGSWSFDPGAATRALREPVRAQVDELGVIAVTGADAASFLQAQLTNDVAHLGADQVALNGYCTPKGRLLATFRCWRDDEAVYLQLPRDALPGVLKRLSMFVLRTKAKLVDDSASWSTTAVFGAAAAAWLRERFGAVPDSPGNSLRIGATRLVRLHAGARIPERFLFLNPASETALAPVLGALPEVAGGAFWWSEIDAAVPTVFAATQERFVPQMINFEVLGGVSFSKGCYPGQEVVARSQFRGKLRRRMQRAHTAGTALAGADVFAAGAAEPIGSVVMAASAPEGGTDLLFECPVEQFGENLSIGAADGPALVIGALPYEIIDVTA